MTCRDPRHGVEWDAAGYPKPCACCGLETRKQAVDRVAREHGGPGFDEQVEAHARALPAANNAEGLIERLAELYRKSADDADANMHRLQAQKDWSGAEFNSVWGSAMRTAARMADTALRNYRGDFSDGTDSPPATPGAMERAPSSGGAQ